MRTIWKFALPLNLFNSVPIFMPRSAQILYVREQGDNVCVWAMVDSDAPQVRRRFQIVGTGDELPRALEDGLEERYYVGAAHCDPFVWHVFDLGEEIQ